MRQFDVALNPSQRTAHRAPLLVLSADHLLDLRITVVAPLIRESELPRYPQLHPRFLITGEAVVLSPLEIANIESRHLGGVVGSLAEERDRIIRALDFLFTGV